MRGTQHEEKDGENEILNLPVPKTESGTGKMQLSRQKNSVSGDTGESLPEVLSPSSDLLREGISDSMTFADNAMSELGSRMEGLFSHQPEAAIRASDPERVQTVALCARTIADLIRAKTEAMKLLVRGNHE